MKLADPRQFSSIVELNSEGLDLAKDQPLGVTMLAYVVMGQYEQNCHKIHLLTYFGEKDQSHQTSFLNLHDDAAPQSLL